MKDRYLTRKGAKYGISYATITDSNFSQIMLANILFFTRGTERVKANINIIIILFKANINIIIILYIPFSPQYPQGGY